MLKSQIESILFVASKPLALKDLARLCDSGKAEVEVVLEDLKNKYNSGESGINIVVAGSEVQLVSNPKNKSVVEGLAKEEIYSELTQPQLEALTIIAYRGPITKLELETIRGINCSLILRNLLIKDLISVEEDKVIDNNRYQVTLKLLKHLGINEVEQLPDYDKLSKSESLTEVLAETSH
ncbi:SMC-Scp complex subunit ScpB [Candidatus Kuenenbacteria bacterium CG_4_9_14_3_um_filter_39_14]|uniref:SMC-Scp complex subunit ScpB n=6 Tax=Candidatus Kueneniibacteriota TaxID=1752740 RepID=A0A2M7IMK4_9BACT|nr:SMC-Scp complex subunit ScpB [Candidatus Kuenenbacteria bacterium]OIP56664.1 MAG: SMC-Scp complex subunit ScpB [Candidatus Kuenenbacteria bacterium CG2_30_39_24]PIP28778.1 MAG: SMC-Scp complex subunit ScpB [Candidatus Kuenenbacteria bacterium CG23_combo_of_CG06-09_8_20_14_all_39_39]PIR80565.1 MAG: SMC-Scp complex subunit ScpB [Candidatus Kuenenbacteria bacterium CG10_big_fil_rev_8_21_14_0_10_39_14]PIW96062.1 MAG: SMC-Scp complex subunit ScpB [Candidatus Kuenenbacteria bacterium CG_4_8_14_3_u